MGRHYHYVPGTFYRADDRSGFPVRNTRTRKQWNNLIVAEDLWEPRQPQDLVKGVRDKQSVPDARPLTPPIWDGPLYFTVADYAPPKSRVLTLQGLAGMTPGDTIGIVQDDGTIYRTLLVGLNYPLDQIVLEFGTKLAVPAGNEVVDYRQGLYSRNPFILDQSILGGSDEI